MGHVASLWRDTVRWEKGFISTTVQDAAPLGFSDASLVDVIVVE